MTLVTVELSEKQILRAVKRLSPEGKQAVLRALIPRLDASERLVDSGEPRMRSLAAERGQQWDSMTEEERESLVDEMLHEEIGG